MIVIAGSISFASNGEWIWVSTLRTKRNSISSCRTISKLERRHQNNKQISFFPYSICQYEFNEQNTNDIPFRSNLQHSWKTPKPKLAKGCLSVILAIIVAIYFSIEAAIYVQSFTRVASERQMPSGMYSCDCSNTCTSHYIICYCSHIRASSHLVLHSS